MATGRGVIGAVLLGALGAAAVALVRVNAPAAVDAAEPSPQHAGDVPAPRPAQAAVPDTAAVDRKLVSARWLAIGGGATPESTQVQIEQDVGLAAEVFGPGGVVLFGAGATGKIVQVQRPATERDPVGEALSELFAPRGGRDAEYRAPSIAVDGEATATRVLGALQTAAAQPGEPLLVFLAGHGEMGERAQDNRVSLWAQSSVSATELAAVLDGARRPVRLVVTTCFSGGFGELAFAAADDHAGAAAGDRCGLFASTWDLEASGCDPNPDRAVQQGYALHFLNALRGRDRDGSPLAISVLDHDGDGKIGLLDAHTRVRIASAGADVPTTTAERWLRAHAPDEGEGRVIATPEEDAVIAALAERLGLRGREHEAAVRLAALERELDAHAAVLDAAGADDERTYRTAAAELLARWPVLDDPWHPEFAALFRSERVAIGEFLGASPVYAAHLVARERAALAHTQQGELIARAAPLERLVRALETRDLARRLAARGGAAFATWERLRACERWAP